MAETRYLMRVLNVRTTSERMAFRTPIKFGGRTMTDVVLLPRDGR